MRQICSELFQSTGREAMSVNGKEEDFYQTSENIVNSNSCEAMEQTALGNDSFFITKGA